MLRNKDINLKHILPPCGYCKKFKLSVTCPRILGAWKLYGKFELTCIFSLVGEVVDRPHNNVKRQHYINFENEI